MAAEKNFENKVKKFLKENNCWLLKYWGGAAYTKKGIPDLLVCCNGKFMGIELKALNGKPSPLQIYNLREIDKAGGFAILLYPEDYTLFQNFVDCIQASDYENATYNYNLLKEKWKHFETKMSKGE